MAKTNTKCDACSHKSCISPQVEVTITKKFYDELRGHLNNHIIHLSKHDRENVNKLDDLYDGTVYEIYDGECQEILD